MGTFPVQDAVYLRYKMRKKDAFSGTFCAARRSLRVHFETGKNRMEIENLKAAGEGRLFCSNELNEIPFYALSASEAKIFIACCYSYQRQHREYFSGGAFELPDLHADRRAFSQTGFPVSEISFRDLRILSNYKGKNAKRFVEDLRKMRMRLQALAFERELPSSTETKKDTQRIIIFPVIEIYETEKKMSFSGIPGFIRCLFGLEKNFTALEMKEIMSLKSIYSIICYRMLRQWRSTGRWAVSYEAFLRITGTTGTAYTQTNINKRVLAPVMKELSPLFEGLTLTRIRDEKKKGRPLKALLFTFTPKKKKGASLTCPKCGRPLYEKESGGRVFWCHPGGWRKDAPCREVYNSAAQIKGYSEMPQRQAEENIRSITEKLSGMFGGEV